jgi:hypothetical protein
LKAVAQPGEAFLSRWSPDECRRETYSGEFLALLARFVSVFLQIGLFFSGGELKKPGFGSLPLPPKA